MRPLSGVKVLDFSTLLPGPFASLMLAEAGAEVTKIERPGGGDDMRAYHPQLGGTGIMFALLNRGKQSLTLDLKKTEDRDRAMALATETDILIDQFRPGVMARLGLSYEEVSRVNPRVIYCSITGYGQTGPKAQAAGHDLNYTAESGLMSLVTAPDGTPPLVPSTFADIAGGSYPAVINILLALTERARTGRGRHLDIAMSEGMLPFLVHALSNQIGGVSNKANSHLITGGSPRYAIYRTRDGKFVAAAPLEEKFWTNFCAVLEISRDADMQTVAQAIAGRDSADWAARFAGKDVCCTIVASVDEALADPHNQARGVLARRLLIGGREVPALPLPLIEAYRDPVRAAPAPDLD